MVAAAAPADTSSPRPPTAPTGPLTAAQTAACAIRDAPCLVWDRAAAAATSRWIAALVQHWAQALRPPWLDTALGREPALQQALTTGPTPGQRLATLVADYSRSIFSARRKMLSAAAAEGTSEFARLARDPPRPTKPAKPATSPPAAPKARKARSKPSAKPKRRPPPPPQAPPAGPGHRPLPIKGGGGGRVVIVTTRRLTPLPTPLLVTGSVPTAAPNRPASSVAQLHLGGAPPSAPYMPTL